MCDNKNVIKKYLIEPLLKTFDAMDGNIDIYKLITSLGGSIEERSHSTSRLAKNARVEKKGDSFVIYVKQKGDIANVRFAIACELGHLFMHMKFKIDNSVFYSLEDHCNAFDDIKTYTQQFRRMYEEVEFFASELLIPSSSFIEMFNKLSEDDIDETILMTSLAKHFNVGYESVFYRSRGLGLLSW